MRASLRVIFRLPVLVCTVASSHTRASVIRVVDESGPVSDALVLYKIDLGRRGVQSGSGNTGREGELSLASQDKLTTSKGREGTTVTDETTEPPVCAPRVRRLDTPPRSAYGCSSSGSTHPQPTRTHNAELRSPHSPADRNTISIDSTVCWRHRTDRGRS